MKKNHSLRKSGIQVIGNVPWGTHLCQFYETKKDLLDVLVPYFKTGLESNEFCVWVTSEFLNTSEAEAAMRKAVPDFAKFLKKGQMEIFPHTEWYLKGGKFEMRRVLKDWVAKHDFALKNGFDGTRVSGNPFWIDNKKDWKDFSRYESTINKVINDYKLLVLCTYSLKKCDSAEIMDVVKNHEFALIKRDGRWENIETAANKKIAESLIQSKERFREFIRISGHLEWTTNSQGEVEEDIPAWRKFTGQIFNEIKGNGWVKALHPEDRGSALKAWRKAVSKKSQYETEYRVKRYDGIYRHFLVRGIPIKNDKGQVKEWIGACIDITERKNSEEESLRKANQLEQVNKALQEELHREESLIQNLGDGILAVDKAGKVIALNRKTENLFGWKADKMKGKLLLQRFDLADADGKLIPPDLRPIRLALSTGKVVRGIYYFIKGKGKSIPLFITSSPVIINYSIQGAVSIYRDISQQIAIDKARDEFISIASHELRTPLSAIAWSLERLYEDKKSYSIIQRRSLDQIYRQTQNMIQLINNLLTITKVDLEGFSNKYDETKPLEIAASVISDLKEQIKSKQIQLKTIFDKNINVYKAYSNALHIILHNLLNNAVKFTPKKGKISLKLAKNENHTGPILLIQVTDTGIGIPKSAQSKVFQKTFRADNVKGKIEGTGLGLYITKALVEHMGGKISLVSKQNKGTIFTVTLPFIEDTDIETQTLRPKPPAGQISLSL